MFRKLASSLLSIAIVVGAVNSGAAAVTGTATLVKNPPGSPFLAPDAALPAPWVSYQLGLATTAGELIGAVDVTVTGNVLHQRWDERDFDGVTDPSPNDPRVANGRGDSHLTAPVDSPIGFGPIETNTKTGSPLTSVAGTVDYGVGNLSGAWGILAPSQTANIAYLVFRSDQLPNLQISVKAATPTGAPLLSTSGTELTTWDFPFIPEPSSMTLMGFAMLCSLGYFRRRRHSVE